MKRLLMFLFLLPMAFALTTTTAPLNTLNTIAIISVFILLVYLAAMFSDMKIIGVLAGLLTLLLGLWISTNGIYYQTGSSTIGATTTISISNNTTSNISLSNGLIQFPIETISYWSDNPPKFDFNYRGSYFFKDAENRVWSSFVLPPDYSPGTPITPKIYYTRDMDRSVRWDMWVWQQTRCGAYTDSYRELGFVDECTWHNVITDVSSSIDGIPGTDLNDVPMQPGDLVQFKFYRQAGDDGPDAVIGFNLVFEYQRSPINSSSANNAYGVCGAFSPTNPASVFENVNMTTVYDYQKVSLPAISDKGSPMEAGQFLGVVLVLIGIYAMMHYGGKIYGVWK